MSWRDYINLRGPDAVGGGAEAEVTRATRQTKEAMMPKKLEQQLKKQAAQKGLTGKRADAYVYGTMRQTGWKPKQEKK